MIAIFVLFLNFALLMATTCPPGSGPLYYNKNLCLIFQPNKTYYLDAEQACVDLRGHLVSVHDLRDNMFLSQQALAKFTDSATSDFWFGANSFTSPGTWTWLDGTPFDYTEWDKGQPQNITDSYCGAVIMHGGRWKSDDCYNTKPFICAVNAIGLPTTVTTKKTSLPTSTTTTRRATTTTSRPKTCPVSWTYYNTTGFCYILLPNDTWVNAEERCKIENAHLASIHSLDEILYLAHIMGIHEAWLGGYTDDNEKHWQWTDGTPFDYVTWVSGEPNEPGRENCLSLYSTAGFNDEVCSQVTPFICKKRPS